MNSVLKAFRSPIRYSSEGLVTLRPDWYWKRYEALGRKSGFSSLHFSLSFDCDTTEDSSVVLELDKRLEGIGIRPAYAVPGELLEKQSKIYGALKEKNREFLNHGYRIHTRLNQNTNQYESFLFYHENSRDWIREDIDKGHRTLVKVLGEEPKGFRAPHFGTFQSKNNLRFLHSTIKELGYTYSSSTLPVFSFLLGPVFDRFGLTEIPVSGAPSNPRRVLDSWGYFASSRKEPGTYLDEVTGFAKLKEKGLVGLINLYADPSQVYRESYFWKAMEKLVSFSVSSELTTVARSYSQPQKASLLNPVPSPEPQR